MKELTNAREFKPVLDKVRPFTMVPQAALVDLALQVQHVLTHNIPGNFVECGVWRGGASFLIAELLRQAGATDRKVWLFDLFEGLPPAEGIDGPAAMAYAKNAAVLATLILPCVTCGSAARCDGSLTLSA